MSLLKKLSKQKALAESIQSISNQGEVGKIDTGSYAVNAILDGNVWGGMSEDSIVALCGESNTGKSYFLAHLCKGAQDAGYTDCLIFDSERAVREGYYQRIGCDPDKIFRVPVGSTTEFRNKAFKIIEEYYSQKGPKDKLFVGLDSLGNLASDKEIADASDEKTAADMGTNAKFQNSAFRVMNSLCCKYNFPFVFTNHVYMDPSAMFQTRGKMSGGAKAIYNSHVILYFSRLQYKDDVDDPTKMKKNGDMGKKKAHVGVNMKVQTVKNREYPEEKEVVVSLRFDEGMNPYSGLLPMAIQAGVIENKSRGFLVTATGKTVYEKDLYNEEVFNEEALTKINEWLEQNGYSSLNDVFDPDVAEALGEEDGE
jgi:RecA/RadA recombinase